MAATVGSLFSTQSERIEEVINKSIDVIAPSLDPVWMNQIVTSQGVGKADEIGRDMQVIRVFSGGLTGVFEQAAPRDDFPLYGDDGNSHYFDSTRARRFFTQGLNNVFPDPTTGMNLATYRLVVGMRAMVGNIMFTLGELQAEATSAVIGQIVSPKLEGFGRNISHQLCNYTYLSQNAFYRLCQVTNPSTPVTTGGINTVTFQPDNEAIDRFFPGQQVDIYGANDPTNRLNESAGVRQIVVVQSVDELTNTVTLVSRAYDFDTTESASDEEFSANCIIVYANSNSGVTAESGSSGEAEYTGIAGLNSWLKTGTSSGTDYLLGSEAVTSQSSGTSAIDVNVYPEHKSLGYDMNGAALTEHFMRKLLRRFHAAKNKYGYTIDTLIASEGVWLAYEATRIGREIVDRSGRIGGTSPQGYNSNENFGGFKFAMDGRTYTGYTSTYVEDGTMYGLKLGGNNYKRYVPSDVRNSRDFSQAKYAPFKFVASALTGLGTNQLPIFSTGSQGGGGGLTVTNVTEGSQMPGWLRMQIIPDQFCGMKVVNCATDKIWGQNDVTPDSY